MTIEQFRAKFAKDFPNTSIDTLRVLGMGEDNIAFLVDGREVVRLPKSGITTDSYRLQTRSEVALLRFLQGKLPVEIPVPSRVAPDESYFGYQFLHGTPLVDADATTWKSLLPDFMEVWTDVAIRMPRVLSIQKAKELGVTEFRSMPRYLEDTTQLAKRAVLPAWAQNIAEQVIKLLPAMWNSAVRRAIPLHGDMGLTNWIMDPHLKIYALIDWSDACIAPIEHHMSYWVWEDFETLQALATGYAKQTGQEPQIELIYLAKFASFFSELGSGPINESSLAALKRWSVQFHVFKKHNH